MKTKLIFLIILTSFVGSSQQWQWAKSLGGDWDQYGTGIGTDKDRNVYVSGVNKHFSCGQCDNYLYNMLWKFDKDGKLLWSTKIEAPQCKQETDANGNTYLAAGDRVVKINSNGITEWSIWDSLLQVCSIAIHPTGGVVISGFVYNQKCVLARYDDNGNRMWKLNDPLLHYGGGADHLACDNQGFIYYASGYKAETASFNKVLLLKLNPAGNIVSVKSIPRNSKFLLDRKTNDFYFLNQGGNFEAGNTIIPQNPLDKGSTYIIKYDSSGSYQWYKTFYGYEVIYGWTISTDNKLLLGGSIYGNSLTTDDSQLTFPSPVVVSYIFRLNSETGRTENIITNTPSKTCCAGIMAVRADYDNNILVTGSLLNSANFDNITLTSPSDLYADMFVAKTKGSTNFTGIEHLEATEHLPIFTVYPNPFPNYLNIEYISSDYGTSQIKIVNVLGSVVYSEIIPAGVEQVKKAINLTHLPKGVYFVTVSTATATQTKKVILN